MKIRDFAKVYFALLALHLAVIYQPESQALYYISKPGLLFSLLAFFLHRSSPGRARTPFALALLFSLLGDVLLMLDGAQYFLGGMAAFGLAHLFYVGGYLTFSVGKGIRMLAPGLIIPVLGMYFLYAYIDLPQTLEIYLYGYALLLSLSFVMAVLFAGALGGKASWAALGALLFVISDLLLAYHRFNEPAGGKYWQMGVMASYALAQYLIVIGVLSVLMKSDEGEQ